jgi:CRP-like cAMP-binding protein
MDKIKYLTGISKELRHRILHTLKPRVLIQGEILLKPGMETETIYLIEKGCLEVYTEFDGNEFVLEFLGAGSVLNYQLIFTEDRQSVYVRARVNSYIQVLTLADLATIQQNFPLFDKRVLKFQNQLLNK